MIARPQVLVIGLGGTIAMTGTAADGVVPSLSAQELAAGLDVEAHSFRNKPGASLTMDDLTELADLIQERFEAGIAGVVVTQGTDTIEETAYVLDLLHQGDRPIVVTGAMRNPTLAGADGPANLLAAITVALDPAARGLGCLVVLADEIHAAARVRKTHSMHVAAFASANGGPLGYVVEGETRIVNHPPTRYTLPARPTTEARVALYPATLGDDGTLLRAVADPVDGLVIAGFGVGHVPESWVRPLAEIATRIPVVLASRTGAGYVGLRTYAFPGSERDMLSRGLVPSGALDPYKARLLLQLLLGVTDDRTRIAEEIRAAGQRDCRTTSG
ncbi:asparaginase [Paractinoplanes durhamensis]|uniref:L-asparaginase n=1 Tax=Paractinoplanes durhamensis TaxID=113563 RepID=A0ABQ3Z4S3_9ACTN|nr:asparaginase [Actinoplanes durhamensis]GIE04838.1 L-asparaginase [Actinoplanes durhamensis]